MLRVKTLHSFQELDQVGSKWRWLEGQCDTTLFQSYELNRRTVEWFSARESPHVVVAEGDSGMAIIPAVRRERELGFIGETLFDYRDVLSAGDPTVLERAWQELATALLPLEVTALRGDAVRARWHSLSPRAFCNAPTTRRQDISAAQFVAAHKKSAKASRRLAREGLRLVCRRSGLKAISEWVYRHKAEWSGQSENLFRDSQRQNLMLNIISRGILNCNIWSYCQSDGAIAAALVCFQRRHCRHFYTIHHDSKWERFSPGQVLIFDVTRESLAEGLDVDFMTGEYAYKNRLATAMIPLYRVMATADEMAAWRSNVCGTGAWAA